MGGEGEDGCSVITIVRPNGKGLGFSDNGLVPERIASWRRSKALT